MAPLAKTSDGLAGFPDAEPFGLYLHIPFCRAICGYCNFNRGLLDEARKSRYVSALEREIQGAAEPIRADTVYFGGGTPSLLEPDEVTRLVAACRAAFDLSAEAEITLEMNPESATAAHLDGYRAAGVTRLSLGVQSFRDVELQRLDRAHTVVGAREAHRMARAAGFDNVSVDLMMWLPGQTVAHWRESIEAMIDLGPDHASLYLLEVYPNAPLRDEMVRRHWSTAPDDDAAEMYLWAMDRLDRAGYRQYEISNVARAGARSRHNLKYWTDGGWLGFGCGAHSTRAAARWKNVADADAYIGRVQHGQDPRAERCDRSRDERCSDALIMGLRLADGIDLATVERRYEIDVADRYGPALEPFRDAGVLVGDAGRLRLTREGMLVSNEIMSVFV